MSKNINVVIVLDRSGSMMSVQDEVPGAINTYVEGLKKKDRVTLVQFDSLYQIDCENIKAKNWEPLVLGVNYQPRGATALNDALAKAIHSQGDAEDVFFVVMTDGYENASKEYGTDEVKKLIAEREGRGWQFDWLLEQGVAQQIQATFGVQTQHVKSYNAQVKGAATASTVSSFSDREAYRASR